MIVVSDTSPLRYLAAIGKTELLPPLFGFVCCPDEVFTECRDPGAPDFLRRWLDDPPEWLAVGYGPEDASMREHPEFGRLDSGEAAAIRLAVGLKADLLLIDERRGRLVASQLGVRIAGTLSVIADAACEGLVDFEEALGALLERANFRGSEEVLSQVRAIIRKTRSSN